MTFRGVFVFLICAIKIIAAENVCGGPLGGDLMVVQTSDGFGIGPALDWDYDFIPINAIPDNLEVDISDFDPVENKVYGVLNDHNNYDFRIVRFDPYGTEYETVYEDDFAINAVRIDADARELFIGTAREIFSANITANLTEHDLTTLVSLPEDDTEGLSSMDLDPVTRRIFYSVAVIGGGEDQIRSVSVDDPLPDVIMNVTRAFPIEVDHIGRKLYRFETLNVYESDLDGGNELSKPLEQGPFRVKTTARVMSIVRDALTVVTRYRPFVFDIPFDGSNSAQDVSLPMKAYLGAVFFYSSAPPDPVTVVKVRQQRAFHGGLIAAVDIPIKSEMSSWVLDIHFPRHVFDLKLVGCKAMVNKKTITTPDGPRRRKAATYRLVSNPGDPIPAVGEKLHIKMTAKAWGGVRRMERGIVGEFYQCP